MSRFYYNLTVSCNILPICCNVKARLATELAIYSKLAGIIVKWLKISVFRSFVGNSVKILSLWPDQTILCLTTIPCDYPYHPPTVTVPYPKCTPCSYGTSMPGMVRLRNDYGCGTERLVRYGLVTNSVFLLFKSASIESFFRIKMVWLKIDRKNTNFGPESSTHLKNTKGHNLKIGPTSLGFPILKFKASTITNRSACCS